MLRRPPISTRTDTLFPTRRSSGLDIAQCPRAAGEQAQALLEHLAGDRGDHDQVDVQVVLAAFDRRCRVGGAEGGIDLVGVILRRAPAFEQRGGAQRVLQLLRHGLGALRAECELARSEEHTSELQSLMRISYAVFCLKKKNKATHYTQ